MGDTLRELEKAHEAKFKLDEELRFKVRCRRNKLFGLWAAERMGLEPDAREVYARTLLWLDVEKRGKVNILRQVINDCATRHVHLGEVEADMKLAQLEEIALTQITSEYPNALDTDHVQVGG